MSKNKQIQMKKIMIILIAVLFLGCTDSDEIDHVDNALSRQEIEDLQFLKEEEKLARDVYLFSYDLYGQKIFQNIANSEQSHMNSVSAIMKKYGLKDLALTERGKFSNAVLQGLYVDLTSLASRSMEEALIVGATIEDLDINDLNTFIENTNHSDVEVMYNKLNCGSRNHLRAYIKNLGNINVIYDPQFISIEEFDGIINNTGEKCNN